MNGLFEAASEVCDFMAQRQWEFCIIGGLAVQRWAEPRATLDADLTLLTGWGEEEAYVQALLERFDSRISDGAAFALAHRVLLLQASNGVAIDITLGALPFEITMVRRAVRVPFGPQALLPCCTADDLFIMKAFAGRPRDWLDAENLVVRQPHIDRTYILTTLADLCALKEDLAPLERARRLLEAQP